MVSNESTVIRISRNLMKSAGFRPGQNAYLVHEGGNSVSIVNKGNVNQYDEYWPARVESDGRLRIRKGVLNDVFGVSARAKNIRATTSKGSVTLSL